MGLPLVVKSHEYKFQKELSETRSRLAIGNEKHIKVLRVSVELALTSTNVLFWRINLDLMSSPLAQTVLEQ